MSEIARLRWKCRRGMKELDVVLEDYIQSRFTGASSAEQGAFRELLELPDPLLYDYLTGRDRPANEEQRRVIDALRRTP